MKNTMTEISGDATPAPRTAKILLVEDSFANRDMLTRRLMRAGFTVCSAADGATGVAMSVSEQPDLILMDVALGEMDGWQATQLIRGDVRTRDIPIIALTAHALASDRDKSIEVGCADFDTKPVDLSRLLGKIEGCLTKAALNPGATPAPSHHHDHDAHAEHTEGEMHMSKLDPVAALTGSVRDFRDLHGSDLMARVGSFYE